MRTTILVVAGLLLAAPFAPLASAASPSATIVSPAEGATIPTVSTVRIHYTGYTPGATNISGYLTLDGTSVTTFFRPVTGNPTNGTAFNVTMNATNFTSGSHALAAVVFTNNDTPVTTPSRTIVLDKAPTITLNNVSYDLDARDLLVDLTVGDEGPSAPLVRLSAGPNATNASFTGTLTMRLDAGRGPGTYNASVDATDAFNQTTRAPFTFTVLDREAYISYSYVAYELGGTLRLRGNATDADGLQAIEVRTPLGSGVAQTSNNTTEWSAAIAITPQLGTFNGTIRASDLWGGLTERNFSFTIAGPNVTVFERTITTQTGAYADASSIVIPPILHGTVEICVDGCSNGTGAFDGLSAIVPVATNTTYTQICGGPNGTAQYNSVPCRQLTGRPGLQGALDFCADSPPSGNLLASTAWSAFHTADNATGGAGCRSIFNQVNATAADLERQLRNVATLVGPGGSTAILLTRQGPVGAGAPGTSVVCSSTGRDARCSYSSASPQTLALDWAQAAGHTVSVRITGVRV